MEKEYDYSISFCRIIGMFMIIICHLGTALDNPVIGQSFQVGVQLFLFISGYLYGNKNINNNIQWMKNRFLRICVPCYLFFVYALIINLVLSISIDYNVVILDILNLQGYSHIFYQLPYINPIQGTAHLWFITVILLCYLFTILIKKVEKKHDISQNTYNVFLFILLVFSIVLGFFEIRIDYLFIYFFGYTYAKRSERGIDYFVSVILLFVSLVLRLLMKKYSDINGDNSLYLYVIIPLSYNFLAFWIFKTIRIFQSFFSKICERKRIRTIVLYLDSISFYIFITHYQFIDGPLSLMNISGNLYINIALILLVTLFGGELLRLLSEKSISYLKNKF